MADLIDRQAVLAEMRRSGRAAYMIVQEASAVDAVEVVRCKDCKHYQDGAIFTDKKFCCRLKDKECKTVRYNYSEDDYCSYGERRNNNE